jgi:Ribosomal subunit 39S
MQLTGLRIPDSAIKPVKTVQALLAHLVKPPKPRKLIDALQQKEELLNLPNVSIYAKRVTPIDKHKSVGRWKVIEQELIDRGLPVTGHGGDAPSSGFYR